jgi:Zn-dependent protease
MNSTLQQLFLALPVIAMAITLHEMMHAFVSDSLGDDTARHQGRITLNPLAHIDPFLTVGLPLLLILIGAPPFGAAKPVPLNPSRIKYGDFGVAIVAIAGPLTNLLLAIVSALLLNIVGFDPSNLVAIFLALSVQINVGFFIFNMIPFPPLDGSRLLYAFAPEPLQRIMLQIESFGLAAIALFMFVIFPLISPIMTDLTQRLLSILY